MAFVLKNKTVTEKSAAARDVSGLAGFNLNDLADEGRSQLDLCRVKVRQMLEDAENEAEAIRKDAERRGYQAGEERAAVDADKKLQAAAEARAKESLELIRQAVAQLHQTHQALDATVHRCANSHCLSGGRTDCQEKA